jgi:hypothetical protein
MRFGRDVLSILTSLLRHHVQSVVVFPIFFRPSSGGVRESAPDEDFYVQPVLH